MSEPGLAKQPFGYQYVTLRLVPSIEREEFVNVGVVLYSQMADFLDAEHSLDVARVRAFAPLLDLDAVNESVAAFCAAVRGEPCSGRPAMPKLGQRFGWIAAPRSTMIQPGPIHGGVTSDPSATLHTLMTRLVR